MTTSDDHGLETPDADRLEQLLAVDDQPEDQDDVGSVRVAGSVVDNFDADEADVLEQAIPLPAEEDYRDR